ncbi:DUF3021 family protein [Parafannyhessea umbonata]|uniref:Uncharacterized protein n=1 Tax=Parafannyhessea umbonata TaxID=604330 RepID=A0A1H9R4H7_9ACTN|nr:DUF3021 family protein [Parafannyhessea umbonata]SER67632.1 Protein of unknown function [Parafannyhessea umbonata]
MTRKDIIDTERKTPAEGARTFLLMVCAEFSVAMIFYLFFTTLYASWGAHLDLWVCWSFLAIALVATTLQLVFFTPLVIKRMPYPLRIAAFGVCLYAVLSAVAVLVGWFPVESPGSWALFTTTFLVTLAIATAAASHRMRQEERTLNEGLSKYHNDGK